MSAPLDISSRVRAVTIYRRGAMVTREAELTRQAGEFPARIQLVGLPLTLDDSSLRVEVEAPADRAAPIAGDLRVSVAVPDEDPQLPPPTNEELDRAQLELELASETLEQLRQARARLASLQPVDRGQPEEGKPPAPSPTAARLELLGFRRERSEQLAKEIQAARERVRQTKERLETLRERERLASSERNTRTHELRKAAILELDARAGEKLAERATIKLHYFVPGARWAPAYTVRLDRDMRSGSLELRAMVGQSTGEDWHDVALTLSTASPQQWTELPELRSRRIGRRQPPPAKTGWRPPPVGADELYADYDRGLGQPAPAEPERAAADETRKGRELEDLLSMIQRQEEEKEISFDTGAIPPPAAMPPPAPMAPPAPMPTRADGSITLSDGIPEPESRSRLRRAPGGEPSPQYAMPVAAAMPAQAKHSAGIGALFGGAIGGIASAFIDSDEPTAVFSHAGGSAGDLEPELVAGRDLLDYGRLRLFPASSGRRGSLRRIDLRMQYEQHSVETISIEVAIDQIREAIEWAKLLDSERPPEGHSWPSSEGGFDYAYVAEAPVDLASTGAFVSLPIDLTQAEATPRYISVPRETQDVFRIVSLRNPLDAPLLPGPADVYVAGKFALTSPLELTPIGGRIELGLGVEQAVKIARNVKFNEDSSGMFKRHLVLRHVLELEIQNHLPGSALVEVRERLPVAAEAQADDIEIEVESVNPSWEDYEPKLEDGPELEGGRVWKVEVPAGGKRELSASWLVTIPTNHELVGGNRRES
jgi:hypothetical protein